jgi:cyclic lactone autoinducer peptide
MEVIKMKSIKNLLTAKTMKIVGSVALFLGTIVIVPTSTLLGHQPKCPDEFLK